MRRILGIPGLAACLGGDTAMPSGVLAGLQSGAHKNQQHAQDGGQAAPEQQRPALPRRTAFGGQAQHGAQQPAVDQPPDELLQAQQQARADTQQGHGARTQKASSASSAQVWSRVSTTRSQAPILGSS